MSAPELRPNDEPPTLAPRPYQILALTGGGYRGLYSAAILVALEEEAGRPLHQVFDMIAGTSIGGILGIGLSCGVSACDLFDAFLDNGDAIFPTYYRIKGKRVFPRIRLGAFGARYSSKGLATTIDAVLAKSDKKVLGDALATLLIPSIEVLSDSHVLFEHGVGDQTVLLRDIALATSAAPTYFPEHAIGDRLFIDGGLVANAPDIVAMTRALARGHALENIRIVSLGTAGAVGGHAARKTRSPGFLLDGARLFALTLQSQQKLSLDLAQQALGKRHIRLDKAPSAEEAKAAGLDKVTPAAASTLQNLARETIGKARTQHAAQFRDILNRSSARL
ncbi:patatin-like phospholipase family protein [Novosphingobium sp. G106]|uniref:CBASS cGAMP-activated phospholipase n=1 Tax=Novosphingobium sp. G106 TaxID=2849500 RepID=UPI001C2D13EE|nr:CBASS cGAMP-activated phospholipase [Novosphingobium sp. G106]MBV1686401.1 patatin-like phospholipase family protein [Novosphingobium sp. G106]